MSFPTAGQITDMTNVSLGQIAQILFSKGFTSQMNRTYKEYEAILMNMKTGSATTEREYRYLLQTALGVNAVKWQQQGVSNVAFPKGDISTTQEVTAVMKKIQATIELDLNMWKRVRQAQAKYIDNPLVMEIQSKLDVVKRNQARALFGDGTGAIGKLSSVSLSGNYLLLSLSTSDSAIGGGNTNWFHVGERVAFCDSTGTPIQIPAQPTIVQFAVVSVNRKLRQVTLQGLDANLTPVTVTSATLTATANPVLVYPVTTLASDGVTGPSLAGADYGTVSPVMAGLESLAANDGRTVFGVSLAGQLGGSQYDAGGGIFAVSFIEESMNETEQNIGAGKYSYDNLIMPYNAFSALIEGKEADRRFNSVEDSARGGRKFVYQYGDQSLDCLKSYFCPFNRVYSLPKPGKGEMGESGYALELRGVEFEDVALGSQKEFLKLSSSDYLNVMQSFLEGWATLIAKQPAAINVIRNFTMP